MTFGEFKTNVLKLIFSYSTAGTQIPATYNNQADYIAMIPGLLNSAQYDIATSVRRLPAVQAMSGITPTQFGDFDRYAFPADCWQVMQGGLFDMSGKLRRARHVVMLNDALLFPHGYDVTNLALEYWRYPTEVDANTADGTVLDNRPETHEAMVFYAAAGLLAYDDAYRAQLFRNEYETRKSQLKEPIWLEKTVIRNVYRGEM